MLFSHAIKILHALFGVVALLYIVSWEEAFLKAISDYVFEASNGHFKIIDGQAVLSRNCSV